MKLLADDGGFCSEDLVEVRAGPLFKFDTDSSLAAWWTGNNTDMDAVKKVKLERFNGLGFGSGQAAAGFLFNGSTHFARVAANSVTDIGASAAGMTIEFWAKPTQIGTRDATILHWGLPAAANGVQLEQRDNGGRNLLVRLRDSTGVDHAFELGGIFADNTWVHVVVTYDRALGRARVFKNAVLVHEANVGMFTPGTHLPLTVGAN